MRGSALCDACLSHLPLATGLGSGTYAVFDYGNRAVRFAIRDLKYHRRSESVDALVLAAAPHISDYLAGFLQSFSGEQSVLFVPIPEHPRVLAGRGFNQSAYIARALARLIPEAIVTEALEKIIRTHPQARLKRAKRLTNLLRSMRVKEILDPKRIVVVIDDVTTTGATFDEARRALKEAGIKKVHCIALAHGYARK